MSIIEGVAARGGAARAPGPRWRLLVLAICCMSLFIVGLDNTIVNIALPSMRRDLHASLSDLQWIIDAYTVVLAGLLMLSGSTADRIGRRRTFQAGLMLFTLGSLLCSLSPSLGWLVGARALQAVGGSMLNPVAMSIITNTFTDPRERARAIGVWGGVVGLSMALGPLIGGVLVASVGWQAIFWINIPMGLIAFVLCALFVPESRAPRPRPVDPVGQILIIALLAGLTYGIIEAPSAGWSSAQTVGCFTGAALALACLVPYELRRAEPLINPRFFRSIPFAGATLIAICGFAALGGFLFLNTLYLQDALGHTALHAGLLTLPMAGLTAVCAPLSGRIVGSAGPRLPLLIAGTAMGLSALMLTDLTAHTPLWRLMASYVLFGLGFGMLNAPITNTAVSGMPRTQAGVAAAVASTSRQIGQSLGVAVVGSLVISAVHGPLRTGLPPASHVGWWIVAACGVAVLLLGILTTGRWAGRTAERTAERLIHGSTETAETA
ncbi:DHA2 family efflux MFS transporter permease subunit [Actinoallomurus purpureus]|uniref:MFS transporter n=1 Tax=Actinoallomurus purpureus TaxID=478114 RepID=UPI0020931927|nr:MFS transporter [Actinoallomurus purpureus]MCO6003854.1 DHA2 family efflux MFS transporter permease subunit [Actinoallomurus purpureus]